MKLSKFYPSRKKWVHKGEFGYVLIVAGSKKYTGSPIFNGVAALRAGADLVTLVGHKRAMDIAASFLPDLITYPLDDELDLRHIPKILELAKNFDALIIGGGLKRSPKTYKAIRKIIKQINLPMVIDAEAIRAVAEDKRVLKNKKVILLPHSEEFRILTGERVTANLKERKAKVKKWAKKLGVVILLKGHIDVISDGEKIFLNKTGSPFMTKGGFGDTLAGICGALLARDVPFLEAGKAAAFINGKAGELAAKEFGEGVLASDIFPLIEKIPKIIKKYY